MITELKSPISVEVVENDLGFPLGDSLVYFLLDYGPESHILWGVVYDSTGEVWWVPNPLIRFKDNPSMGRNP